VFSNGHDFSVVTHMTVSLCKNAYESFLNFYESGCITKDRQFFSSINFRIVLCT